MQKNIHESFNQTTGQLLQAVSAFSQDNFNKVSHEGSWTAAQVADHLYKAEKGIPKLLMGGSIITTRPPDEKVKMIESAFLDFSTKLKSPDFILPSAEPLDVTFVYNLLSKNKARISELVQTVDLKNTFTGASLPVLGQ